MLQEKALRFALELGLQEFKASNGWLECFLKRNNIVFGKVCGESREVNPKTIEDWIAKLPELTEGYSLSDMYNMDETGLFFRAMNNKSFYEKGTKNSWGKKAKERVTVSLCANLEGNKEKLLMIGKSKNPRAFKNINVSSRLIVYKSNKKSLDDKCHFWRMVQQSEQKDGITKS